MKNKGIELAISTLILIIIGVAVLIGLIYLVTDGFESFRNTTGTIQGSVGIPAVREACDLACRVGDRYSFCCKEHEVRDFDGVVTCEDSRLGVECGGVNCEGFSCE
jgi:hypothetical protein